MPRSTMQSARSMYILHAFTKMYVRILTGYEPGALLRHHDTYAICLSYRRISRIMGRSSNYSSHHSTVLTAQADATHADASADKPTSTDRVPNKMLSPPTMSKERSIPKLKPKLVGHYNYADRLKTALTMDELGSGEVTDPKEKPAASSAAGSSNLHSHNLD